MGSKSWHALSVLVVLTFGLVGCNNTPQKQKSVLGATDGFPPAGKSAGINSPFPKAPLEGTPTGGQTKPVLPNFQPVNNVPNNVPPNLGGLSGATPNSSQFSIPNNSAPVPRSPAPFTVPNNGGTGLPSAPPPGPNGGVMPTSSFGTDPRPMPIELPPNFRN